MLQGIYKGIYTRVYEKMIPTFKNQYTRVYEKVISSFKNHAK